MLEVHRWELPLRFTRSGEVLPWLGSALRGIVAARFKQQVCRHEPSHRDATWRYCTGCPHMSNCPYGQMFEPDSPDLGVTRCYRQDDAARPVVLAPRFPLPARVERGGEWAISLLAVGPTARHVGPLISAVTEAGRAPGIGPQHVTYEVLGMHLRSSSQLDPNELPNDETAGTGRLPRLVVRLSGPLYLRRRISDSRRPAVLVPQLSDLFGAAHRTVLHLLREAGYPQDGQFERLKQRAQASRLVENGFRTFEQRKWSNRSEQRMLLRGATGYGIYENVSVSLLPWLHWGGRLHVGMHRVAGAGGWELAVE